MTKVLRYLMMAVLACFFMVPSLKADAATIAILPLINKTEGNDNALLSQVYYDRCINAVKNQGIYNIVDNEQLDRVVEANTQKGVLPTEQQLRAISEKANVDLVLVMDLTKYDSRTLIARRVESLVLDIKGTTVYFNRLENKFTKHDIYVEKEIEEVFSARWDPLMEEWGRAVSREINKALKNKKLNLEAPKMTKW